MRKVRWRVLIPGWLLVVGLFPSLFGMNAATAEQYRMVKGKNVPICELCKRNVESFDAASVRCGREYNPKFTDLKPVEWTKLDLLTHKDLVRKIERFAEYRNQDATGKTVSGSTDLEFEETLRNHVRRETLGLSTAVADFDNDGQPEVVLRVEGGPCPSRGAAHQFFVVTPDRSALDVEKTNLLSGWALGTSVGIFLYENTTYVDVWDDLDRQLTIYKFVNGKAQKLCAFKYREDPETSKPGR